MITAYLIIKPVRNSIFLDRVGSENLPYAYISTALFVGMAVWAYSTLIDRLSRTGMALTTWGFLGGGLGLFWLGFQNPQALAGPAGALAGAGVLSAGPDAPLVLLAGLFYFFSAVFGVLGVTSFWSFSAEVLDPRQGRRLYGFVQTGAILGGLCGAGITSVLVGYLGTEQMLLVSAALCLTCGGIGAYLTRVWPVVRTAEKAPEAGEKDGGSGALGGLKEILASRYLLLVCGMILCFQLVSTFIDYQFNTVVNAAYPVKDEKTAFFGMFILGLNTTCLLFQTVVTTRILRMRGLGTALYMLPACATFGAGLFLVMPVFAVGCLMRMTFGVLDYSLDRSTRELLYLPTSREVKTKAKAFIDMFLFRFFRALAGIVILSIGKAGVGAAGGGGATAAKLFPIGVATVVIGIGWLAVARGLGRRYVVEVRRALLGVDDAAKAPDAGGPDLAAIAAALEDFATGDEAAAEVAATRLQGLVAQGYAPSDIPGAFGYLADADRRPLAQELMDGVTPPGVARMLVRILDPSRDRAVRRRLARKALRALGRDPGPEPGPGGAS